MNRNRTGDTSKGAKARSSGRPPRRRKRLFFTSAAAVLLGAVIAVAFAYTYNPRDPQNPISQFIRGFSPNNQPFNILLIGNNARNPAGPLDIGTGGGGQADIMMIAHIDPKTRKIALISIPRDLLFAQPQYNDPIPKIKTLFFIGAQMQPNQAAQLTVQSVEKFTGMPIRDWIVTDFKGFVDAINAVGGVRVYVPGKMYDPLHSHANLNKGWQTLNGQQALSFVRIRQNTASSAGTNDFMRNNYQAQVLQALQKKLLNRSNDFSHIGALIATWMNDVVTNMSPSELVKVARAARGATVTHVNLADVGDSMELAGAPLQGFNQEGYITGAYYDVIDPQRDFARLKPFGSTGVWTGLPFSPAGQIHVDVYGGPNTVHLLKAAGYQVTVLGGSQGYGQVQVDYPAGHLGWGAQVSRTLATGNSMVQPGSDPNAVVVYGN